MKAGKPRRPRRTPGGGRHRSASGRPRGSARRTYGAPEGREAFDQPRCFDIVLNYACQGRCLFCSQDFEWRKAPNAMPLRQVGQNILAAYKQGFRRLGITGGEPTLRKDLPQIIALAKKVGFGYVRMQTNGIRLADYAYCRELARAGLTFVKFSIHGHDAATHDGMTGVRGSFEACLKAIRNLRRLKVGCGLNILLTRRNYRHLGAFFKLFLLKLQLSDFVMIAPLYEGNMTRHVKKMSVRLSEMAPYIREVYSIFSKAGFPKPPLLLHFTPCVLPGYEQQMLGWSSFNTMVASPDGEHRNLDESAAAHAVKPRVCRKCVYDARCVGLDRTYAAVFGTGEVAPLKKAPKRYDYRLEASRGKRLVFTDNERCVLEVLKGSRGMTTREFLKRAHGVPICQDCSDENAVITAAEALIRAGRVSRSFRGGKYVWRLK